MSITRTVACLAALAFAACGEVNGPADDEILNADVALVAANSALDAVGFMTDAQGLGLRDPTGTRSRTITFFDAAGHEQDHYDPLTTASIRIQLQVEKEASRDGWTGSLHRTSDLTVSGLEGEETTRTWNGTGSEAISRSLHTDEHGTRTYELSGSWTVADIVIPVAGDTHWPLSGTFTHDIIVTFSRGDLARTRERHVVITFNGTRFVPMTVNGEAFELDLEAHRGFVPALRLRR